MLNKLQVRQETDEDEILVFIGQLAVTVSCFPESNGCRVAFCTPGAASTAGNQAPGDGGVP